MKYVTYLPDVLKEIQDFSAFGQAIDPETDQIRTRMIGAAEECFPQSASEAGIARFENMFGIRPDASDSLEQRRFRILGRFRNLPPFSMGWLREKLAADCGIGNFSVFEDVHQSLLRVSISASLRDMAELLFADLRENIPAAVVLKMGILHQPDTSAGISVLLQVGGNFSWKE